jgi:hypothetical protein
LNRWIITSSLAGALALPLLIAPATASASCHDRQVTGTVLGGVGGALIGNSIARGGGGAVLGGLGGAVLGHEVARSTCRREHYAYRREAYHRGYRPYGPYPYQPGAYQGGVLAAAPPPERVVYYDDRGNLIEPAVASPASYAGGPNAPVPYAPSAYAPGPSAYAPGPYASASDPSASACRTETQSYYDERGQLVQRQVQTCAR